MPEECVLAMVDQHEQDRDAPQPVKSANPAVVVSGALTDSKRSGRDHFPLEHFWFVAP